MSSPAVLAYALRTDGLALHTDRGVIVLDHATLDGLGLRRVDARANNGRRPEPVNPDAAERIAALDSFAAMCATSLRRRIAPYSAAVAIGTSYTRLRHHTAGAPGAEALLNAIRDTIGIPERKPKKDAA